MALTEEDYLIYLRAPFSCACMMDDDATDFALLRNLLIHTAWPYAQTHTDRHFIYAFQGLTWNERMEACFYEPLR